MSDMTKAEKKALKVYPLEERKAETYFGTFTFDQHAPERKAYVEGYLQAEKDCALIPEDIKVIFYLVRRLQYKYSDISGCFEEALKLFNKARENEQA